MKVLLFSIGMVAVLVLAGLVAARRSPPGALTLSTVGVPPAKPAHGLVELPRGPELPEFKGIARWLSSEPLTRQSLAGKVVLIDFWTYTCINCIRTLPYVTQWYERYKGQGLVVVGVHTPEFAFEKERANVEAAMTRYHITYPVAQDNEYDTWNAYGNRFWPAHYLFDAQGYLRYTHFGEGNYDETETAIKSLLAEAGQPVADGVLQDTAAPDFSNIKTPETYLGYERGTLLGSPEAVARGKAQTYSTPHKVTLNKFYLAGQWRIEPERAVAASAPASITYRYHASNLNLVMSGGGRAVRARITLDGKPVPENFRGSDTVQQGEETVVEISAERLYNLIDAKGQYGEHTFVIEFLGEGVAAYAFTFG